MSETEHREPVIRQMKYDEVEPAVRLFGNAGLYDAISTIQAYYECDPAGFVVAYDEENDEVIGSCAAPLTTHNTCFLGLYVVHPKFQKRGLGVQMFKKCLEKVGEDNNCGLSAVPSKFEIYKDRAGFQVAEGRSIVIAEGRPHGISQLKSANQLKPCYHLAKVTSADYHDDLIKHIIMFDKTVHLDNREKLLRLQFSKPDVTTLAVVDSTCAKVLGYGCIRLDPKNRSMIGPLYAKNSDIAEVLLGALLRSNSTYARDVELSFITTDNSPGGIRLAVDVLGLVEKCRCAKLYTKFVPRFNYERLYAIHTPDFSC